jgi:transposase-like protein
MPANRTRHSSDFKARVALEAIRGHKTANQLASEYGVHATQIGQWKKQLLAELPTIFSARKAHDQQQQEELTAQLYQQIGQLKVELDWLKKKAASFGIER